MARTEDPNRLRNGEAATFRKTVRNAIDFKGQSYAELADKLAESDEKWDEQAVRNRLRLGPQPILAPDAIAIWRAVASLPSRRGWHGKNDADFALLKMSTPWPAWRERYDERLAGPGVNIPRNEIVSLATMIAEKLANTRAARKATQRKIEALLAEQSPKMGRRWREVARDYVGVAAAAASRREVEWKMQYYDEDVIRMERDAKGNARVGNNHDLDVVFETIDALAVLTVPNAQAPWKIRVRSTKTIEKVDGMNAVVTRWEGDSKALWEPFSAPSIKGRIVAPKDDPESE